MDIETNLKVYRLHIDAKLPSRQSAEAAGYDICCLEDFSLRPGDSEIVRTGLIIQPPLGYHTELIARSGLSYKYGIMLKNNVGLIDRDFSGPQDELKVMLYRIPCGEDEEASAVHFEAGDRIAQLVIRKTEIFDVVEVYTPPKMADRGGFGSTGV